MKNKLKSDSLITYAQQKAKLSLALNVNLGLVLNLGHQ